MPLQRAGSDRPRRNAQLGIPKCGHVRPGLATRSWHACFRSGVSSVPRRTVRSRQCRTKQSSGLAVRHDERPSLHRLFPLGVGIHPADGAAPIALVESRLVERPACRGTKMVFANCGDRSPPGRSHGRPSAMPEPLPILARRQCRAVASSSLARRRTLPARGGAALSSSDDKGSA
jgi:hypothetical protein